MKRVTPDAATSKVRFNAADLLLVALALLCAFNVFAGFVFGQKTDGEYRLTVEVDASEVQQFALANISAVKGAKVYLIGDEEPLGELEKDFSPSDGLICVIVKESALSGKSFVYGDPVGIRIGDLYSKNAIVKNLEEVSGK